jgi:uncharacterized protein (DUF697 family)
MSTAASGILRKLADTWARMVERPDTGMAAETVQQRAIGGAPVIWLVGKVQSGKSSIVAAVTGAPEAEVGSGFKACTRTARVFDFPAEAPVIRFMDTRGLGEAGYVPDEDMAIAEAQAHLLLVVMRALDPQQADIVAAVAEVRRRRPDWPVVVAQTCLHDGYAAGADHIVPYPFTVAAKGGATLPDGVPEALARSLLHQRRLFDGVGGKGPIVFVPIDFTKPGDGYNPAIYGLDALMTEIGQAAPAAVSATIREIRAATADRHARRAHPTILGHAAAAAAADAVPVAGVAVVPGVQARMLHELAKQQGVAWDRRALVEFGGCLGAGVLTRLVAGFGIRQLTKLVPVYGQTVGAAAAAATSFATTYALGKAALVFLERRRSGGSDPAEVAAAYGKALEEAFTLARARGVGGEGGAGGGGGVQQR